ncbi:MAG: ABC transporter ATP-binding protein [Deltaproteobacteria bacterium]|nr:ABC transporter ATP-binding protein [Deltaproteobacteria bacterium]
MEAIVRLEGVEKDYELGKTIVPALREIDLEIARGEFTTIAGPSGSGKTTLLNLVGCVDVATRGEVHVDGHETHNLSDRALTTLRLNTLGFIFQSFNLVPVLSVFQNVELPLLLGGRLSKKERKERVEEIMERVGLADQLRKRPNELSGGQRQRVAIGRALVGRPKIVLADEPTANLDSKTGANIIDLMRELNQQDHTTFIFSTHDPRVWEHARRIIKLEDGRIVADEPGAASGELPPPPAGEEASTGASAS